ncbi:MAG: hypothetical protein ABFE08_19915 [Armatimonadia bacterium]
MKFLRFDDPRVPRLMQEGARLSGYGIGFGEPDGYILADSSDEADKRGCWMGMMETIWFGHEPRCWCGLHTESEIPDAEEQERLRKQWADEYDAARRLDEIDRREEW